MIFQHKVENGEIDASRYLYGLLGAVHSQFSGDWEIMQRFAREHATVAQSGSLFSTVEAVGAYTILLPYDLNYDSRRLVEAPSLSFVCGDSRQVKGVVDELSVNDGEHALVVMAGGAAQPVGERMRAMAQLARGYLAVNPEGIVNGVAHTGFCGRLRLDYGPTFYEIVTQGGQGKDDTIERGLVQDELHSFLDEMIREDLPHPAGMGRVRLFTSHVSGDHSSDFHGVTQVQ